MENLSPKILMFAFLAIGVAFSGANAQDAPPDEINVEAPANRPNLLEALGLTPEQILQIRMMNRDRRPKLAAAQQRLREANRALDMAVYADELNEADVRARLREFHEAQAGVAALRIESEVSLRRILTPDQLAKFRGLRARAAAAREFRRDRRNLPPAERPPRGIRQLPRRNRVN